MRGRENNRENRDERPRGLEGASEGNITEVAVKV